jgi:hypothetical protein
LFSFKEKVQTKAKAIAQGFDWLFTSAVHHKSDSRARKVYKGLRAKHKLDSSFAPFSAADMLKAIEASKNSSAVGLDGLIAIHLKHLGPMGASSSPDCITCLWLMRTFQPSVRPPLLFLSLIRVSPQMTVPLTGLSPS